MTNNPSDKKDVSEAYKIVMNNELYSTIINSISDPDSRQRIESAVEEYVAALVEGLARENNRSLKETPSATNKE